MLFEGKVALVTGAASGIGRAAALIFAREGAAVTVADIDAEKGGAVVAEIEAAGGRALFVLTDVTSEEAIAAMVARTVVTFGGLDAAFNNAGTVGNCKTVLTCDNEEWESVVRLNMTSVWWSLKYEIPELLKRGGGGIVNTASRAADRATQNHFTYIASKHGVVGITRSAAIDYAPRNVRVNALMPGPTATPMLQGFLEGRGRTLEEAGRGLPMKRLSTAEEQAEVAVWLCSSRASHVTGVTMNVDGGMGALI